MSGLGIGIGPVLPKGGPQKVVDAFAITSPYQKAMSAAAGTLVGAAVGAVVAGESFTDVLFAMNGALGAGVGYLGGVFVAPQILAMSPTMTNATLAQFVPLATAIAVPMAVEGGIDMTTVAIGASVFGGAYLAHRYVFPRLQKMNPGTN